MTIDQFEQHLESLLRSQFSIELVIGFIGLLETSKHLHDSIHEKDFITAG